jgi:two-component system phosphate regulon response regulator PhoB
MNHILIADDEPSIGSLIEATLQGPEVKTTHVTTGKAVLEAVRQKKFDLIVLDWMMPGMSGLDVVKALRKQAETVSIPIIMLTARGQLKDQEQAMQAGAHSYLMKPFSPLELLEKIQKILKERPADGADLVALPAAKNMAAS